MFQTLDQGDLSVVQVVLKKKQYDHIIHSSVPPNVHSHN